MIGLIRVVHPLPVALVVATTVALVAILSASAPHVPFLGRAAGVVLSSQVAVGALNDYLDRNIDALNQPEKPIPAGDCPPAAALGLIAAGLVLLVPLGLSFGLPAFALALLGTAIGITYDIWLKPTPYSILAYIAGFLTLFTWILVITARFSPALIAAYPAGAMIISAGHLAQALPDIEIDASLGQRSLAVLLGPRRCLRAIVVLYLLVAGFTLVMGLVQSVVTACLLVLAGIGLVGLAWRRGRKQVLSRDERKRLFRLLAPAIAILVVAEVLILVRI